MSSAFPSKGIKRKFNRFLSADDTILASTITVPDDQFGIMWKLWVSLDVASEADLHNLPAILAVSVVIGTVSWLVELHPYIARGAAELAKIEHIDLGPWDFDFGIEGLYSGVKGHNIVVAVAAAGTGIKVRVDYIYSGD